ncbi:MAG: sugar transferase [Chloroflexi bacterium]|nr:sugar transferase [Chloroflexota bacterium]
MIRSFSTSFTIFLLFLDTLAALLAIRVAEWLRLTLNFGQEAPEAWFETPWGLYIILPITWILILHSSGAYSPSQTYRAVLEIFNLLRALVIAILIIAGIFYFAYRNYSRVQAFYLYTLLGVITIGNRGIMRLYFRLTGGRKYDSRRLLIVGTNDLAMLVAKQVRSYAWTGLYLAGFVAEDSESDANVDVIGSLNELDTLVDDQDIDEVVIAIKRPAHHQLLDIANRMYKKNIKVRFAPDLHEIAYVTVDVEQIDDLPLISLRDSVLTPDERIVKRLFDIAISISLCTLALPILLVIALAIRLESKGSPLFFQERIGQDMKPFKMIKFRTMVKDAEKLQDDVNLYDDDGNLIHKRPDDPRITRVGRFLRRTSLDELPQLINIIKGDMSLVGPRPEMPWMVDKYEEWQLKRFEVPQGLTGWWQVNGRSETPMHLATEDDLYYIQHYSLALDLMILLRTPAVVLTGKGAF